MTEDEKKKLEAEVMDGAEIPADFEAAYLENLLADHKREVMKVQVNFRMFSYTRDDESMQKCKAEKKRLTERITFFEKRLAELKGNG